VRPLSACSIMTHEWHHHPREGASGEEGEFLV
jgi:hypothetical protein